MGDTKIILISRRWPKAFLEKVQQGLGLLPRKAGHKLLRTHIFKVKKEKDKI